MVIHVFVVRLLFFYLLQCERVCYVFSCLDYEDECPEESDDDTYVKENSYRTSCKGLEGESFFVVFSRADRENEDLNPEKEEENEKTDGYRTERNVNHFLTLNDFRNERQHAITNTYDFLPFSTPVLIEV